MHDAIISRATTEPVVVPQQGEAALARVAQAAQPNSTPHNNSVNGITVTFRDQLLPF
jgi:hypothetical protein